MEHGHVQGHLRDMAPTFGREERGTPRGLRLGGVYLIPDGAEVVAGVPCGDGRCFLYHPLVWEGRSWILSMPVAYEINPDGSIVTGKGIATGWSGEQMVDTGRTAGRTNHAGLAR